MGSDERRCFDDLLRRHRVAAGLTQAELAERAGISERAVSDLERGLKRSPRRATLALLAEALALEGTSLAAFEAAARSAPAARSASVSGDEVTAQARARHRGGYLGAVPEHMLVARDGELQRIRDAIRTSVGGAGRLVLLAGEPGVGKTRLAQEAMRLGQAAGLRVLVGRCYEEQTATPFLPFVEVLNGAWLLASADLRQSAGSRHGELGRLLPELLAPPSLPEDGDALQRVLRAVGGFLQALAGEGPLAVLLDDLQWADSASLHLLASLARTLRAYPVLLLGTYRDVEVGWQHPLEATLTALLRDRVVEIVPVQGLPPAGTAELLRARSGLAEVSGELRDQVHERTEGNPFFIEEVLAALVEQGAIYREGGRWERKAGAELRVPRSVRAVVGQRVGRLVPAAQALLRLASVLGQEFDLDVLLAALDGDEEPALDQLEVALHARLLEERRVGRQERYAFVHALIAQTLYEAAPRFQLRRLHLRVAEALERLRGDRPDAAAELARHFLAGGDEARAVRYAMLAGDRAAALYAHLEAVRQYETALELSQGAEEQVASLRRKLARVLVNMGRTQDAVAAYGAARTAYERAGDQAALAEVEREIGEAYLFALDPAAAAPHFEAALDLWPASREDTGLVHLLLGAAQARHWMGDLAAAQREAERGLALAERLGAQGFVARGLAELGDVAALLGRPDDALALLDRAELLAREAGSRFTLYRTVGNRGLVWAALGELRRAREDFRRAAELAVELDMPRYVANGYGNVAWACCNLGDWSEGRIAARAAARALEAAGMPPDPDPLLSWLEGDHARALEPWRALLSDARRRKAMEVQANVLSDLARCRLDLGQIDEALGTLDTVVAAGDGSFAVGVLVLRAEAAVLAGNPDAPAQVEEATATGERYNNYFDRSTVLRARGLLQHQQGASAAALTTLQQSAEVARRQCLLPALGRTLFYLAEVARTSGDEVLADAADAERAAIIAQIGPEVRGLVWST